MPVEEFTVDQNKGYVAPVSAEASVALVDQTEHKAMASVVTAKADASRAETAEKEMGGKASGSAEGELYAGIATDMLAPGLKMASSVIQVADTRLADGVSKGLNGPSTVDKVFGKVKDPITFDQKIKSDMARAPGAYRTQIDSTEVGVGATIKNPVTKSASASTGRKAAGAGEDLMARASITETSLKDQGKDALKSWDVPEEKLAAVSHAKKFTYGLEAANKAALASVQKVRAEHSAVLGAARQLAPGLSLGSGPSINPATLLREAEQKQNESWKSGGTA